METEKRKKKTLSAQLLFFSSPPQPPPHPSPTLSFGLICTALPDAKVNAPHNCVKQQLRGGCLRMFGWLSHSSECDTLTPAATVLLRGRSCHSVLSLTPHITAQGRRPEATACYLPNRALPQASEPYSGSSNPIIARG